MIFGRTHLRISVSEAKFDAESDFEIHFAVASQKHRKKWVQMHFGSEKSADFFLNWGQKIECRGSPETRVGKV